MEGRELRVRETCINVCSTLNEKRKKGGRYGQWQQKGREGDKERGYLSWERRGVSVRGQLRNSENQGSTFPKNSFKFSISNGGISPTVRSISKEFKPLVVHVSTF